MSENTWPLVLKNDDGIRSSGIPDECFYCKQKVGQPHGRECVAVYKKFKMYFTFEVETCIPYLWDEEWVSEITVIDATPRAYSKGDMMF